MTEAYAIANDQLRKERDAALARAEAAEKQWAATAMTPDGGWHVAWQAALARAEAAEKERGELKREVTSLSTKLEVVTAERDSLRVQLEDAKPNPAPRTLTDLEEQTGPVAFERNQLRDELAEMRAKHDQTVTELNSGYDTLYDELTRTKADRDKHEHRAAMHERDADEASRAVAVLSTIIRAAVEAIARGVK